jgi:hypothetical protein
MAYNENFPADDSYLSDFPAGDREQNRALKDDQIVNAGKLQGLTAGNKNGQIPINNGTENANLNAALLNGKASSYFATSNHNHNTATQSSNGYMSNADKKKLDGIASGAEVNQNAFANVKVGTTTIQADAKQDTLTLAAGTNISLVGDANNDKVTIGVTGTVASATTAKTVSNTAGDGSATNLVSGVMASNDGFRIRVGGTNNNGYAEIATKDDGSEPIYVRQYTGDFSTITRTATILDGSGNTTFPGKVTASGGFSGNLSGTATSATNATRLSNKGTIAATTLPNSLTTGLTTHDAYNNSYPAMYGNVINIYHRGKSQLLCEWKGDDTAAADPGHLYYRECRDNQNAWSNWRAVAFTTDNVSSATKATQDSAGQTINTTYVKGVSANNATLTITKGNGSTSTTTINNVSNANNLVISGTSAHIKYGGGDVDENTAISQNKVNLLIGSWFSTGFRDLCSSGTPIRVAINHRNGNIKTTGNVTANGAMYSATPGTSDNSTRVATTAFVQSLINSLKGLINAKNDVYIGAGTGSVKNTSFTIPLPSGYSRSQCKYAVFPTSIGLSTNNGYFSLSVDQSTGIVRGSVRSNITGGGYRYSDVGIGYLVVAVK